MVLIELLLAVLLTGISLRFGGIIWLRRVTIVYLVLALLSVLAFGLNNVARFGMVADLPLLKSQVKYADAYRAGLLSAQDVANRYIPMVLLLCVCLAVLAWFPMRRTGPPPPQSS
jgi:hypothetical protein